jgi:hypothetical protein
MTPPNATEKGSHAASPPKLPAKWNRKPPKAKPAIVAATHRAEGAWQRLYIARRYSVKRQSPG